MSWEAKDFAALECDGSEQMQRDDKARSTTDHPRPTDDGATAVTTSIEISKLQTATNNIHRRADKPASNTPVWRRRASPGETIHTISAEDTPFSSSPYALAAKTKNKQWLEKEINHSAKPSTAFRNNLPYGTGSFATAKQGSFNGWPDRDETKDSRPITSTTAGFDNLSLKPSQVAVGAQGKFTDQDRPTLLKNNTWPGSAIDDGGTDDATAEASTTTKARYNSFPETNANQRTYKTRYTPKSEKKTGNGKPWSSLYRGVIVEAIDSGRLYTGQSTPNPSDVVEIKNRKRMFKNRFWLITDRMNDHVKVRPICTRDSKGLLYQPESIRKDSMCIFPFDEADQDGWVNEVEENEVLYLKAQYAGVVISATASVRATQTMMLDREKDFIVVAEMGESEVRKVEELEHRLAVESRTQA